MLWLIQVDIFIIHDLVVAIVNKQKSRLILVNIGVHDLVAVGSSRSSVTLAEITIQMYILAYDLIN